MNLPTSCISIFVSLSFFLFASCTSSNQQDYTITWQITDNSLNPGKSTSELHIQNTSGRTLESSGWSLYFNYIRTINPESVTGNVNIERVNGDFYEITPTNEFTTVSQNESATVSFSANGISIKESDAPSGFYFAFDDQTISNIGRAEIGNIALDSLYQQFDKLPRPNAEYYYEKFKGVTSLPKDSISKITPKPKFLSQQEDTFVITEDLTIAAPSILLEEVELLAKHIQNFSSIKPKSITQENKTSNNTAAIILDIDDVVLNGKQQGAEAYNLQVSGDGIRLTGSDAAGVYYGIQSLNAWMMHSKVATQQVQTQIPGVHIIDAPRFGYRGFHLDVARNFQSSGTVKKLLDAMARYKLNTFHFHLTDDEGWRLAINALPELTQVGGRRGHTSTENDHLIPSYGSGPYSDPETSKGSGWYSRQDFVELLEYAHSRHIKVIPEIDLPGHARAAIIAMETRNGTNKTNEYRLTDPNDTSQYRSVQGWDDNVINVCRETSYHFIETVFDEIISMYDEAGAPLNSIHIGGDEVPSGVWEQSPICNDLINKNPDLNSTSDLPNYFFGKVQKLLTERGLIMSGWQEVALDHHEQDGTVTIKKELKGKVRPYVWLNIWGSGTEDYAYRLANQGFDVIMSQANMLYFDMAYDHHPEEPGFYWAAFIDDRDPFRFMPLDLFKNGIKDQFGEPIPDSYFNDLEKLNATGEKNIMGLQGQLWGETLTESARVDYMALPRLLSLAERAWSEQPEWATAENEEERLAGLQSDWNEFANRIGQYELPRLDDEGSFTYQYHISAPGIKQVDGNIHINTQFPGPGADVRYTTDGTMPDENAQLYSQPFSYNPGDVIKARVFSSGNRGGRVSTFLQE